MDQILRDISNLIKEFDEEANAYIRRADKLESDPTAAAKKVGAAEAIDVINIRLRMLLAKHMKGYGR